MAVTDSIDYSTEIHSTEIHLMYMISHTLT